MWSVAAGLALGFLASFATVPVHEAGHLLFGLLVGGRFKSYRAYGFEWSAHCRGAERVIEFGSVYWEIAEPGEVQILHRMPVPWIIYRLRRFAFALSGFALQVPLLLAIYGLLKSYLGSGGLDAFKMLLAATIVLPNLYQYSGDLRVALRCLGPQRWLENAHASDAKRWASSRCT